MPPTFLAFSLSFLYPMPLWKVGAPFVKKQCITDPKKSYFLLCLQVFYEHCPSKPLNDGKRNIKKMLPVQVKCNFLRANKLNTNSPKATFYCKLVFFAPSSLPQDTPKVCKSQSRTFTPPQPPPSKTYRGESDIHRFPSSKSRTSPPQPPPSKTYRGLPVQCAPSLGGEMTGMKPNV